MFFLYCPCGRARGAIRGERSSSDAAVGGAGVEQGRVGPLHETEREESCGRGTVGWTGTVAGLFTCAAVWGGPRPQGSYK